jgi:hypothetical protein
MLVGVKNYRMMVILDVSKYSQIEGWSYLGWERYIVLQ